MPGRVAGVPRGSKAGTFAHIARYRRAERDQKIARLQREVADKTDRLGRLAKEMGELKAKGLGKIFR